MGEFTGKTAVITGSSRGLGFSIAKSFAAAGANVVLAARKEQTLNQAIKELTDSGFSAIGQVCDTAKSDDVNALANLAEDQFGKIDIWVNNAGVGAPYGSTLLVPQQNFEAVIQTNILGVYYGSITAMKRFLPNHSGKLINLVGRGADRPVPYQNAYASSKTWVRSFTNALAQEYKNSEVSVISFNPGLVITDMTTQVEVSDGFIEKVQPLKTVMRLWANPPEVPARKVLWLASAATDGKTGLNVDIITPALITKGLVSELGRKVTRKPDPRPEIHFKIVG